MKIALVIPARYGSTRFPGKPLAKIAGKTMLARVIDIGRKVQDKHDNVDLLVATEDQRIADHCDDLGVTCIMTSEDCATGSDRILEAVKNSGKDYDFVINLQGDTPFTPPVVLLDLLIFLNDNKNSVEVLTPVYRLNWSELKDLRKAKETTPFSGTTVVRNESSQPSGSPNAPYPGQAIWFSKNIIPAIRNEDENKPCPILKHIGIYCFRYDILEKFVNLEQSFHEKLEGLEQLRLIENGIRIHTAKVKFPDDYPWKNLQGGIDSPEDIERAEKIIAEYGEPSCAA